jgi:hypothetical protein
MRPDTRPHSITVHKVQKLLASRAATTQDILRFWKHIVGTSCRRFQLALPVGLLPRHKVLIPQSELFPIWGKPASAVFYSELWETCQRTFSNVPPRVVLSFAGIAHPADATMALVLHRLREATNGSMSEEFSGKLNQLQRELPEGLAVDSAWLKAYRYSASLKLNTWQHQLV